MHAVVTGATGCIGRNVVDALIADHWQVTALHRASSDLSRLPTSVHPICVNLHDVRTLRFVPPCDVVFHCAGNTAFWNDPMLWRDNVLATWNLRDALNTRHFMFTSTAAAPQQQTPYATTKYEAENAVSPGQIIRPVAVTGKYDWNGYTQIVRLIAKRRMPLSLPGNMEFARASDVGKAHILAYENGDKVSTLHGERASWHEIMGYIARKLRVFAPRKAPRFVWNLIATFCERTKRPWITRNLLTLMCQPEKGDGEASPTWWTERSFTDAFDEAMGWMK